MRPPPHRKLDAISVAKLDVRFSVKYRVRRVQQTQQSLNARQTRPSCVSHIAMYFDQNLQNVLGIEMVEDVVFTSFAVDLENVCLEAIEHIGSVRIQIPVVIFDEWRNVGRFDRPIEHVNFHVWVFPMHGLFKRKLIVRSHRYEHRQVGCFPQVCIAYHFPAIAAASISVHTATLAIRVGSGVPVGLEIRLCRGQSKNGDVKQHSFLSLFLYRDNERHTKKSRTKEMERSVFAILIVRCLLTVAMRDWEQYWSFWIEDDSNSTTLDESLS